MSHPNDLIAFFCTLGFVLLHLSLVDACDSSFHIARL